MENEGNIDYYNYIKELQLSNRKFGLLHLLLKKDVILCPKLLGEIKEIILENNLKIFEKKYYFAVKRALEYSKNQHYELFIKK